MKILKISKVIITILVMILLIGIATSNISMYVQRDVMGKANPSFLGYSTAIVVSGSMAPEINTNDMILTRKQSNYQVNDIVTFQSGKSIVTHRIIREENEGFVTKGDANNVDDRNHISNEDICGKVIFILPGVGNIISFFQSPLGMFLIVFLAFLIIIFPFRNKEDNINKENIKILNK